MRAAAILFVVCSHALWVFPEAEGSLVEILHLMGVMGVEIFFVLSGFLIGRILFRLFTDPEFKEKHFRYFLIRRWFRTLPNYYLILLVNIAVTLYLGRDLPESLGKYFFFLQNASSRMDIFFTESWSLPVEEFAYILGPLLLYASVFLAKRASRKQLFLIVTLLIIGFFLATKVWYNTQVGGASLNYWNENLKAVTLYRIDAIYYGVLAAYLSQVRASFWTKYKASFFALGIALFMAVHFYIALGRIAPETHSFFWNVLYLPLCSLSIAMSLPVFSEMQQAPKLIRRPITFISLISYSMYLLHYSIVLQLMKYRLPVASGTWLHKILFSGGYLAITILLAYVLYRWYEKPMMDIRDRPFFRNKFKKF